MQRLLFIRRAACTIRCYSRDTFNAYADPPRQLIAPVRIVKALQETTGSPLWRWIDVIHARKRVALHESLAENKVTFREYNRYEGAVKANDISGAVAVLDGRNEKAWPPWLLMFTVAYKVNSPYHASVQMLPLVQSHLPSLPLEYRPGLLILAAFHLARFAMVSPLRVLVDEFLPAVAASNPSHQHTFYNLFLKSLAGNRVDWGDNSKLVLSVLKAMESRQIKLWSLTYHQLLNDRHVTIDLTIYLRERMIREGFVPQASHFEDYIRVFANDGAIQDPKRYRDVVANFTTKNPLTTLHDRSTMPADAQSYANSAFHFLRHLATLTSPPERQLFHHPLGFRPSMTDREWNSTFASLTKPTRRHIPAAGIKALYRRARRERKLPDSIFTYSTIIRAFIQRGHLKLAKHYWDQMIKSGFILDAKALTVGMQLFAAFKRPDMAFDVLERHAQRVDVPLRAPYRIRPPVALTVVSMNQLLQALHSIRRPDGVFLLWEHMVDLYGVHPDATTLEVVLRSVRMAMRMDDTPSGALKRLGVRKGKAAKRRGEKRHDVVRRISDALEKDYVPFSVWKDPFSKVGDVFWKVVKRSPTLASAQLYPGITPTSEMCYEYALLAGVYGKEEEIPEVLKTMRQLDLKPGKDTLPMALAFWHDACAANPTVKGEGGKSRWKAMVDWLVEWVGEEALPSTDEIKVWKQNILIMKEY